jgi:hypothetical protein
VEKDGKQDPPVEKSESLPVEEVPRTNTRVEIENPDEIEGAGEDEDEESSFSLL